MKNTEQQKSKLDEWADDKVKDLIFACVFNVKMVAAGQCPLLLRDMSDRDYTEYQSLLKSYVK
jgi:hypothetical protein